MTAHDLLCTGTAVYYTDCPADAACQPCDNTLAHQPHQRPVAVLMPDGTTCPLWCPGICDGSCTQEPSHA